MANDYATWLNTYAVYTLGPPILTVCYTNVIWMTRLSFPVVLSGFNNKFVLA